MEPSPASDAKRNAGLFNSPDFAPSGHGLAQPFAQQLPQSWSLLEAGDNHGVPSPLGGEGQSLPPT
jgi:hypothetical protein